MGSALIFAITVNGIMVNALVAPIAPDIAVDLGQPIGRAAVLLVAASLPGIFVAPITGFLADRNGRRSVLVRCLVIYGVGGLVAAAAPTFGVLIAARVLQGVGSAGLVQLSVVLIGDHRAGQERAQLMGYNAAVLAAVPAVLPIVAGSIAASWSWRAVFVLYSVAFVTACAVRVSLDDGVTLDRVSVARQLRGATQSLRERGIRQPIGVGFVVFLLIYGVTLTILPIVLSTRLDVGPLGRGALLSLPALTSTAASLSIGRLSARFHDRGIVRAGLVVLGLGCLVTGIGSVQAVVVGALLAGLGEGLVIPGLLLTLDQSLTTSRRGVVMAVWVASARAGQTAGAGAAGLSLAALGLGQTTSIAAALGLTTVAWMHFHPVEQIGAFR